MILACEIMKWTAKSTDLAEFTLAPQYSPPAFRGTAVGCLIVLRVRGHFEVACLPTAAPASSP